MSELNVLLNMRSLRARSRDITLEQLEDGLEKLTQLVDERREFEADERAARAEHDAKLQNICGMIAAEGIDTEELMAVLTGSSTKAPKAKRAPRPAKYKWEQDGVEKTWTGQGRTPAFLAEKEAEGKLDDYLI